jgi:hypothetical protein
MLLVHCLELIETTKCGLYILPALLFVQCCDDSDIQIHIHAHSPQLSEICRFFIE